MNLNRRAFVRGITATGIGCLAGLSWGASERWPSRPIRVLSGGSSGGTSDIFMRFVESGLRQKFGQAIVIENMPGVGGTTAALAAARATDGHTFFISNLASNVLSPLLYKSVKLDQKTELPAVARFCTLTNGLVVRSESGISTANQLFDLLKADASKRVYSSGGAGTTSHLTCVMLSQRLGVDLLHVPYKGTAENLIAILRGDTLFTIDNLPSFTPNVKKGTLKLLAVSTASRSPLFPEVPTLQEVGLKNFDVFSWFGLSAATATPRLVIDAVSDEVVTTLADPTVMTRFRDAGAEPAPMRADAYSAFIQSEIQKWAPLVRSAGVSAG